MPKLLANTVLITGLVSALIAVLVAFGVNLNDVQIGAIMGVLGAFLALLGAYFSPSVPGGATTGESGP